jgi:hypothetical protein
MVRSQISLISFMNHSAILFEFLFDGHDEGISRIGSMITEMNLRNALDRIQHDVERAYLTLYIVCATRVLTNARCASLVERQLSDRLATIGDIIRDDLDDNVGRRRYSNSDDLDDNVGRRRHSNSDDLDDNVGRRRYSNNDDLDDNVGRRRYSNKDLPAMIPKLARSAYDHGNSQKRRLIRSGLQSICRVRKGGGKEKMNEKLKEQKVYRRSKSKSSKSSSKTTPQIVRKKYDIIKDLGIEPPPPNLFATVPYRLK